MVLPGTIWNTVIADLRAAVPAEAGVPSRRRHHGRWPAPQDCMV